MGEGRSEVRCAPVFDFLQVLPQPADHFLLLAIPHLLQELVEGEVNHVVMMQFFGRDPAAELEPNTVQQVDFLGRQVRRMGAEIENVFLAAGGLNLEHVCGCFPAQLAGIRGCYAI